MRLYVLAMGFSNIGWSAWGMESNVTCYVFACSCRVFPPSSDGFLTRLHYLQNREILPPEKRGWKDSTLTCVTCSLPVKTGKFTCFYAPCTSRRIQAIACNKVRKLQVTSLAGCRLTYLHIAGEITRGVIVDCLQLQVVLFAVAGFFACDCAGVFACELHVFLPAKAVNFAGESRANLHELRM